MATESAAIGETKIPEITGALVEVEYSVAPISELAPWGRALPSISSGTAGRFRPASMPGEPAWRWKSYGGLFALTNNGSGPIWFAPMVRPDESARILFTP